MCTVNEFLTELLSLQQDGSGAISAPANWQRPPLLEVRAPVDDEVDRLIEALLSDGGEKRHAAWHFFIGAPGNGKSAAAGKLYRQLRASDHAIVTEDGTPLEELEGGPIPYVVHVREGKNEFATAWLAQDASVVRDPFAQDVDPANDLIRLLEDAWEEGVSLMVCTNRGVLEKAYRTVQLDTAKNRLPWARALRHAEGGEGTIDKLDFHTRATRKQDPRPFDFDTFGFSYTAVDQHSLLIGHDLFEQLLKRAVESDNWRACAPCRVRQHCPFHANKEYLESTAGSASLSTLLQRAELLSGQIVVFREAVALISFLLAGCSRDYSTSSPCEWVHDRAKEHDYFALLSRRFYASLLSSYAPYGLEHNDSIRDEQLRHLGSVCRELEAGSSASSALSHVCSQDRISTDVGIARLLGPSEAFSALDPLRGPLSEDFYATWDAPPDQLGKELSDNPIVSSLEQKCFELWADIERQIEKSPKETVERFIHARRWITSYTFRLGAFADDAFNFAEELDAVLETVRHRGGTSSPEETLELRRMETELGDLLRTRSGRELALSRVVGLGGQWSERVLRPSILPNSSETHPGLAVSFGEGSLVILDTHILVWLKLRSRLNLQLVSFPTHLLQAALDSQVDAASTSGYAYEDNYVALRIEDADGRVCTLERVDGDVHVAFIDNELH